MRAERRRAPGSLLMTGGLLLLAAALFLTGYNLWEQRRAEQSVSRVLEELDIAPAPAQETADPQETVIPDYLLAPTMEMPTEEADGKDYIGVVEIPALGLSLPVMSGWSYPDLKIAPCRYAGSAYQGDLIIMAHNYRSHFGNLKNLSIGDEVVFRDVDGNEFRYEAVELETLEKTAVEEMQAGDWDLTLFTCTVGGQTRVTVRCIEKTT